MAEHRVPMLGASWRRSEDPAHSRDPRVRAVVGALASLPSPEPGAVFRAELRAQLVAIAPRIVAESAEAADPTLVDVAPANKQAGANARPKHADGTLARLRGLSLGRPLAIAATVLTAFVVLMGGAVWMSQKSLPGDTLYGLKRASESFQLWMDGNDSTARARDLLNFAGTRVDEANKLASRASADAMGTGLQAGTIDSHTADLIASTLGSADSDVRDASSLLTKQAVSSRSRSPLEILTAWAPGQLARLRSLAQAVPDGSLRQRARSSAWLVNAATNRAKALASVVGTGCTAGSDSLGAVPSASCGAPSSTPRPGTSKHHGQTHHAGNAGSGTNSGTGVGPLPGGSSYQAPLPGGSTSTTPITVPSLPPVPLPTSSLPVSVGSCGVDLLGVKLTICPTP